MAPQMPLARAGRPAIGQPYNGKCAPDTQCANKKNAEKCTVHDHERYVCMGACASADRIHDTHQPNEMS